MFCLVMMRISLELAKENVVYEGLATKFFEHYVYIGAAMKMIRGDQTLWDEQDGFFYDLLRFPDGSAVPFRVRSLVGLIPFRLSGSKWIKPFDVFARTSTGSSSIGEIVDRCVTTVHQRRRHPRAGGRRSGQLKALLARGTDSSNFSPYGIRSIAKRTRTSHSRSATPSALRAGGDLAAEGWQQQLARMIWFRQFPFHRDAAKLNVRKAFGAERRPTSRC